MTDNVVKLPLIPRRYPPYASLMERIKEDRERQASKARVQEDTNKFCADTWRTERYGNALVWCDRALTHPLGGKQWVLEALDELKQYVERK